MGLEGVAVADAGPLIHLDELGALTLLTTFDRILVPDVVRDEVARHRPALSVPPSLHCEIRAADPSTIAPGYAHLQDGELAALALCKELGSTLLLTDDLAARAAARTLGITPVGSLGIVMRAARLDVVAVDVAERYVVALGEDTTLFTTPALIATALRALRA